MAWITPDQVAPILGHDLTDDPWIEGVVAHVEGLAEAEIGEPELPLSKKLTAVVVDIAVRLWRLSRASGYNLEGVSRESLGDFTSEQPQPLAGFGLTNAEKDRLRRAVGNNRTWVQPVTRGPLETSGPPMSILGDDW